MKDLNLANLTVLYAEDEELARLSLVRFLSKRVKQLFVAENGKEGLKIFLEKKPDIVITDIRMPIMDGLTMARHIKEAKKDTPIIVTTAFNDETYFLESIDIGVDKYVKKPVNTSQLQEALSFVAKNITMQTALDQAQRKIEEQYHIMKEEMSLAAVFQQKMMPKKESFIQNPDYDVAYYTHSYSPVSGDFLIIEDLNDKHFGMFLIDVMGHGVAAGLVTIELKTIFEDIKNTTYSPAEMLRTINEKILCLSSNTMFFTAIYAIYDKENKTVTISSAGGIPFIFFNAKENKSEVCFIEGDPIGLFSEEEFLVSERTFQMSHSDLLMLQTDGLIESFDKNEEKFDTFFSQKNFIEQIHKNIGSQELIENIIHAVNQHKGEKEGYSDDATIIAFKKK